MIFKSLRLAIILLLVPLCSAASLKKQKLEEIAKSEFSGSTMGVAEKKIDGAEYYFTLVSRKMARDYQPSQKLRLKRRLKLMSKGLLLKHVRKSAEREKVARIRLKGWVAGLIWENDDRLFLISYVKKDNVEFESEEVKNIAGTTGKTLKPRIESDSVVKTEAEPLKQSDAPIAKEQSEECDVETTSAEVHKELKLLKESLKENKAPAEKLGIYWDIYNLYKMKEDVFSMDKTMNKIMRFCFAHISLKECARQH